MSAFSAAIDAIFADANMAADAVWEANGVPPQVACRVIRKRPDEVTEYGGAVLVTSTVLADVRVSEVPDPRPGDHLTIGAERFVVQGKPRRDRERLVWMMELAPK